MENKARHTVHSLSRESVLFLLMSATVPLRCRWGIFTVFPDFRSRWQYINGQAEQERLQVWLKHNTDYLRSTVPSYSTSNPPTNIPQLWDQNCSSRPDDCGIGRAQLFKVERNQELFACFNVSGQTVRAHLFHPLERIVVDDCWWWIAQILLLSLPPRKREKWLSHN